MKGSVRRPAAARGPRVSQADLNVFSGLEVDYYKIRTCWLSNSLSWNLS